MKFLVIIATLVACCYAAPTSDLQHPSPINPNVLVEQKPQEKVVLITDPNEIAKFKRETNQPLYPTALPEDQQHHIAKRDNKSGHKSEPAAQKHKAPEPPKKSAPHTTTKKPAPKPHSEPAKKPAPKPHSEPDKKPSSNKRNRRDVGEIYQTPQILPAFSQSEDDVTLEGYQKPQTLPIILTEATDATEQHKRDIPVPLVPKHQHPEESPKESSEEKSDEVSKEDKKEKDIENHPNKDEVQVEDLSEPKPYHQTLNFDHSIPSEAASSDDEQKPNITDDHLSTDVEEETSSLGDLHHIIRPKPVPVAELFARAHDN